MVTSLSALTNLEYFRLHFPYSRPRPALENRCLAPRPPTRTILPSLTKIIFRGAIEYLDEILNRIVAPRLNELRIALFNQIIFDTPQLFQFISRRPTLRAPEKGHIAFNSGTILVEFPSQTSDYGVLGLETPCTASEWQLSSLEQVCTSPFPPLSALEDLYIFDDRGDPPPRPGGVGNMLPLGLLRSFVAVKNLFLSGAFMPHIAPALQELVGRRTTEVFPNLENIFLIGSDLQPLIPLHEGIVKFVAARQSTSRPVAVSHWDNDPAQQRLYCKFRAS